jgi:hypothetical protein
MGLPSGREVRRFLRMSKRRPDFGSQHLSRRANRTPADGSSSRIALPVDSLADEPLGRDARPHSPFAAMLLSPEPFRVEVSGRTEAQPVRRCITHLLPVRPAYAGRTNLTSQGAPRRVTRGELNDFTSNTATHGLAAQAESDDSRLFAFSPHFIGVSATGRLPPTLQFAEIIRGPNENLGVTFGPRISLERTLRLSHQRFPTG